MGTQQLYIRRNVWALDPTQAFTSQVMLNYAKAVRVMQQRDRTDPTSWSYQAAIHGTPDPAPPGAPWNQCQHSTWYFLPWHRMYLWFFEQIVREAIAEAGGDPTGWALPYWNYSDGPQPPVNTLPLAFRVPTLPDGSRNALHLPYPLRNDGNDAQVPLNAGINDGVSCHRSTLATSRPSNSPTSPPHPAHVPDSEDPGQRSPIAAGTTARLSRGPTTASTHWWEACAAPAVSEG